MKTWTTKDLLYKIFEFKALVPNSNQWNENNLKFNKPRLIRLRRINALLRAFELTRSEEQKNDFWTFFNVREKVKESEFIQNEITRFLTGDFLNVRKSVEYPNVQALIEKEKSFEFDCFQPHDIYLFYHHLMKYRMRIEDVLQHNSGVLEASILGFSSAVSLTTELNNDLLKKVEKVDKLLFEIINPKNLVFEEAILIKKHGFPKDDLDKIDSDNW